MPRRCGGALALVAAVAVLASGCSREAASGASPPRENAKTAEHAPAPTAPASADAPESVELCEHGVPAELCTRCTPDLVPVFKEMGDWCAEHGVPESQCLKCHPDLKFGPAAPLKDWCKEHAVPESKCAKCHPALIAEFIAAGDYCREHGHAESVCPYCHPELVSAAGEKAPEFPSPGTLVRLASAGTAREAGIRTMRVENRPFARTLEVVGRVEFNRNRLAQVSARGEALVLDVKVDVGDEVKAGQALVVLASADVGADQSRLTAARARVATTRSAFERARGLADAGVTPRQAAESAQRELAEAEADLSTASVSLRTARAPAGQTGGRYVLTAPFAGTVIARNAVTGRLAPAGEVLVELADVSTVWMQLDVPEADSQSVRPGQPVALVFEGLRGETREGTIARVAPTVDPHTRTVRARVELPNADRSLRAGLFVRARIRTTGAQDALLVPVDAIQRAEGRTLVFVRKDETTFEPVAVELGATAGGMVEIVKGLAPGADVVTTGAFVLKTEILKESIGAGCCGEE